MGSRPEMGGPVIGKEHCLVDPAQYTIKHSGKKPVFTNKWEITDATGVVIYEAIREKTNSNAWSFKYETRVTDVQLGMLVARFKFTGSKWVVFDGESDEVLCTIKEDKLDLKVFRTFNSQADSPDYKTKTSSTRLCMPWNLLILRGKESLAQVSLKNNKWHRFNEYLVEVNEGVDAVFVLVLVLMMQDMERMFAMVKATSFSPIRFFPALSF